MTRPPLLHRVGCWVLGLGFALVSPRGHRGRTWRLSFAVLGQSIVTRMNMDYEWQKKATRHVKPNRLRVAR